MSELKIQYLGARKMEGTSKTGNEYKMCNLYYVVDAEARLGPLQKVHIAIGKEIKEKSIPQALFDHLQKINLQPLSWVTVTTDVDPENIDRTIFTSVKPASVSKAA